MSEVAEPGRRGFFASFQYVTVIGGQVAALGVVVLLQHVLTHEQLVAWGWRIPFALGAVGAVVALYLRRTLDETLTAKERGSADAGTLRGLVAHRGALMTVLGFTAGGSLLFYTFTTYMQKYLVNTTGLSADTASMIMTGALIVFMLMQPLFGALSDRIGRRRSMILFGTLSTLGTVPVLTALKSAHDPLWAFALIVSALAIISLYTSISGLVKAELFPAEVRALGVGLPYAIANALFGGSAEYAALSMKAGGHETAFFWYVTAMALVATMASLCMRDPARAGFLRD